MQSIKSDNYINIQGWMVTELGLKNSELLIYAIIYGFSQDGNGRFRGTIGYLMDWTQASRQTVINALKSLSDRGLIAKEEVPLLNGQRGIEYRALTPESAPETVDSDSETTAESSADGGIKIRRGVQNLDGGGLNFRRGGVQNLDGGVQKLDPYNKLIINNNTKGDNNIPSSAAADGESEGACEGDNGNEIKRTSPPSAAVLADEFETLWKLYPRKEGKEQAWQAFRSARRSGVSLETILAGIEKYIEQIDREQIGMRFVIQGGNWFKYKRWEDGPPQPCGIAERRGTLPKALAYKQHHYSAEQLAALGVDFGEDVYEEE